MKKKIIMLTVVLLAWPLTLQAGEGDWKLIAETDDACELTAGLHELRGFPFAKLVVEEEEEPLVVPMLEGPLERIIMGSLAERYKFSYTSVHRSPLPELPTYEVIFRDIMMSRLPDITLLVSYSGVQHRCGMIIPR